MAATATPRQEPPALADEIPSRQPRVWFSRRRADGWTILTATGELDATATAELKHEFDAALADGLFVIVDLSRACFVDDSAKELLVGMDNLLRAFGGRLSTISTR